MLEAFGLTDVSNPFCELRVLIPGYFGKSPTDRARVFALIEQNKISSEQVEPFLSLEFGDDFGDTLLNIAEKIDTPRVQIY